MKKVLFAIIIIVMLCASAFSLIACKSTIERVKIIDIKLTDEEYAFAVNKGNTILLADVNKVLADIKADGTFDEIVQKYFDDRELEYKTYKSPSKGATDNQLVVATNASFPPFEFLDGDKFAGIDIEIAVIIAEKLGKQLVISNMDFSAVTTSVENGMADIAMAGLTINEERKKTLDFSEQYFKASQKLLVKESNTDFDNCKTADDVVEVLKAKKGKIGFQNGTVGEFFATGDVDWGYEGFSNLVYKGNRSGVLAIQDLSNGNLDYVVLDEQPAIKIIQSINAVIK